MESNKTTYRLFLGIALEEPTRAELKSILAPAFGKLPGKAVVPEDWHITLAFLGETSIAKMDELKGALGKWEFPANFIIEIGRWSGFPQSGKATVLTLETGEGTDKLLELVNQINRVLKSLEFPLEDKEYRGHLTLSRSKMPIDMQSLSQKLPTPRINIPVRRVVLFQSTPSAVLRYLEIASFALQG